MIILIKTQILALFTACIILSACNNSSRPVLAPETIFDGQGMQVITSSFNKKRGTMSILFGNEPALEAARKGSSSHLPGEIFTLVTWQLDANPYWFGGNINGSQQAIEIVKVLPAENNSICIDYEVQKGNREAPEKANFNKQARIKFIFDQKASVFP